MRDRVERLFEVHEAHRVVADARVPCAPVFLDS